MKKPGGLLSVAILPFFMWHTWITGRRLRVSDSKTYSGIAIAVQLLLHLFNGEVNLDGAVSFKETIDFWNACPIQHQDIQHFYVVG